MILSKNQHNRKQLRETHERPGPVMYLITDVTKLPIIEKNDIYDILKKAS